MRLLILTVTLTMTLTSGHWVVTTDDRRFDGPFQSGSACNEAAESYADRGYAVRRLCRYFYD